MIFKDLMISSLPLLAQGEPQGPNAVTGMLIPMLLIGVMFYFVLIRPQRKQQKAMDALRNSLRIGDKVVTIGGMHGTIAGQTEKTVSLKVADGVNVRYDRSAIATVVSKGKGSDAVDADESEEDAK